MRPVARAESVHRGETRADMPISREIKVSTSQSLTQRRRKSRRGTRTPKVRHGAQRVGACTIQCVCHVNVRVGGSIVTECESRSSQPPVSNGIADRRRVGAAYATNCYVLSVIAHTKLQCTRPLLQRTKVRQRRSHIPPLCSRLTGPITMALGRAALSPDHRRAPRLTYGRFGCGMKLSDISVTYLCDTPHYTLWPCHPHRA